MPTKGSRKKNPKGKEVRHHVTLPAPLYDALEQLGTSNGIVNPRNGQGNRTRVIERLFAMLPVFSQAKCALELTLEYLPEKERAIAEAVILQLEELEIEQAYEEAAIERGLPEQKSGAWIV